MVEDDPSPLVPVAKERFIAKGSEFSLGLSHEYVEACFRGWYLIPSVVHENLKSRVYEDPARQRLGNRTHLVERPCQVLGSLLMCDVSMAE